MKKKGRPKYDDPGMRSSYTLSVRLRPDQDERLRMAAKAAGMSKTKLIKSILLREADRALREAKALKVGTE